MIAIFIVAFSGISATKSSMHIKTFEGIILNNNSNIYKISMDKAVKAVVLESLIHINVSKNLKIKIDEILKSSISINYQIKNLSQIYAKATSKTSAQQLIGKATISALNALALNFVSEKTIDEKATSAISS